MGDYTTNFKLYKPEPDEVVDVNSQYNRNLEIIDFEARRRFGYKATDLSDIPSAVDGSLYQNGFKYWVKAQQQYYRYQDGIKTGDWWGRNGFWTKLPSSSIVSPWVSSIAEPLAYRIIQVDVSAPRYIEWSGILTRPGNAAIGTTENILQNGMAELDLMPSVTKAFLQSAEIGATNSYIFVKLQPIAGQNRWTFVRQGGAPANTGSTICQFSGIRYPVASQN